MEKVPQHPLYLQLYHRLRRFIIEGVYPLGSKLPSKRTLAEENGISVIPVEHALTLLCDEGYVEARERSGYFVIYRREDFGSCETPEKTKRTSPPNLPPTIPADAVRRPDKESFPFSVLAKAMRKVIADWGERLLKPSPHTGCPELKAAIVSYLRQSNGIAVKPEQIVIGAGAEYLYSLLTQLLGKERTFALENPSYEKIRKVYTAAGVSCDLLTLAPDGILTSELTRTSASVLHITPFHSYPSGVTATATKRQEYLHWVTRRKGYIIEDNYDSELTVARKREDPLFSFDREGRVIYLNTFSRTVAPSVRVGYMILPQPLLPVFEKTVGFYSCTVPVFEQYLLAELIQSGDFQRHINRVRRARRKIQSKQ